jgi:hypothetical protein
MDQSDRPRITGKLKIKKKNYGTVAWILYQAHKIRYTHEKYI